MKLFLINWGNEEPEMAAVAEDLQNDGHDIAYWVRSDKHFVLDRTPYANTIFHDYFEAVDGVPATHYIDHPIDPPSSDLLSDLSECQGTIFTMMERDIPESSILERFHLYTRYVGYWHHMLTLHKPDAIVFPTAPHRQFDYVIYSLAKYLHIKTVMLQHTVVSDRMFVMTDFRGGHPTLPEVHRSLEGTDVSLDDITVDVADYYRGQHALRQNTTPVDTQTRQKDPRGLALVRRKFLSVFRLPRKDVVRKIHDNVKEFVVRMGPSARKEYEALATVPDFLKPAVFVPLHFQPEATTCPMGGYYVDQLLMIETLLAALPEGWQLYVKEHKTQWTIGGYGYSPFRPKDWYAQLSKDPRVVLLPADMSSKTIIPKMMATATITGTAGWESLNHGKPALIFGYPWYVQAPGVSAVRSVDDCRKVFSQIVSGGGGCAPQDILRFLCAFDRTTRHGYLEMNYGKKMSSLSAKDNRDQLHALLAEGLAMTC